MRTLNIDVNNLCCFMAQDKVGEFTQQDGKGILRMTLKNLPGNEEDLGIAEEGLMEAIPTASLKSQAGECPHIALDNTESAERAVAVALPVEKPLYKEDAKVFARVNDKMRRGQLSGIKPSEDRTWLYLITVDGIEPQWIDESAIKTTLK